MYIRLSSLRQTRFGYADSAFCISFSLPIFLFIYNMLNNLKSVTLFPIFFKKNFITFFCARRTICRRRGSHSPAIFSGKAGIGGIDEIASCARVCQSVPTIRLEVLSPAIQPVIFNMPNNPKNVTLFAKKIKKNSPAFSQGCYLSLFKNYSGIICNAGYHILESQH